MLGRSLTGPIAWALGITLGAAIHCGPAQAQVVISEVLTHADPPWEDAIELQNLGSSAVDLSHWWLSDSPSNPAKYRIPPGTTLGPGGFAVFYQVQFGAGTGGFSLNSSTGDQVVLTPADAAGVPIGPAVTIEFGPLRNGVSAGRHATSAGVDFVPLSQRTFGRDQAGSVTEFRLGTGLTNAPPRVGPLVISEIHFAPFDAGGNSTQEDEFIELQNAGAVSVPLFDPAFPTNTLRLAEGITFTFPYNRTLPAGGYLLLVGFDPVLSPATLASFRSRFSVPSDVPLLGPFGGRLSNSGEAVALLWPDEPEGPDDPDAGLVPYEQLDRIVYSDNAPWPNAARGTGFSLQRRVALDYANEPLNWFAAFPTPGRASQEDTDTDGIPDAWEWARALDPRNASDAATDPDGDGHTNHEEYLAGTEPRDAFSVLRIESVRVAQGRLHLRFTGQAGKAYVIESREDAGSGAWSDVVVVPARDFTGMVECAFPIAPPSPGIVRVRLVSAP